MAWYDAILAGPGTVLTNYVADLLNSTTTDAVSTAVVNGTNATVAEIVADAVVNEANATVADAVVNGTNATVAEIVADAVVNGTNATINDVAAEEGSSYLVKFLEGVIGVGAVGGAGYAGNKYWNSRNVITLQQLKDLTKWTDEQIQGIDPKYFAAVRVLLNVLKGEEVQALLRNPQTLAMLKDKESMAAHKDDASVVAAFRALLPKENEKQEQKILSFVGSYKTKAGEKISVTLNMYPETKQIYDAFVDLDQKRFLRQMTLHEGFYQGQKQENATLYTFIAQKDGTLEQDFLATEMPKIAEALAKKAAKNENKGESSSPRPR